MSALFLSEDGDDINSLPDSFSVVLSCSNSAVECSCCSGLRFGLHQSVNFVSAHCTSLQS